MSLLRVATPASGGTRHLQFTPGTAVTLALAYLAWEAARMTGSRLGLFVCFASLATLLLDLGVAFIVTRRARFRATVQPTDGVVGDEATVCLSVSGTRSALRIRVGPSAPAHVAPPGTGPLTLCAGSRGVISVLEVEAVSLGWCGLVGFLRRGEVELARPFAVGPRPVQPAQSFPDLARSAGEEVAVPAATGDMVRGVRDYVPGDRLRLVHWRATARLGALVVKEVEETTAPTVVVALHLADWSAAAEEATARAAWYVGEARRRGCTVILATRDASGPVTGSVGSSSDLNWRLARAVVGAPELPAGGANRGPVLLVTAEGDAWR
ncbi:MAG: DUF58 domain-containing protein [Actinomycetota bacterium]|nr:DUF58 domain-containing protein [Actinomycetota bacterium]PLS75328.1 MAG: hypothetical protein CYG61_07865 [Actinomycetota bacterium]